MDVPFEDSRVKKHLNAEFTDTPFESCMLMFILPVRLAHRVYAVVCEEFFLYSPTSPQLWCNL